MFSRAQSHSLLPVNPQALMRAFVEPQGKVFLLYGESPLFRLSLHIASGIISKGASVALIDGCNRFDVHAITRYARQRRINPDLLLERIFISRGFTSYQMEAAITQKLPQFLDKMNSRICMIFGLLDTFYDEQAKMRDVREMLVRILASFKEMKKKNISLLLASNEWNVLPSERNLLFDEVKNNMDRVYRFMMKNEQPQLMAEQLPYVKLKKGV